MPKTKLFEDKPVEQEIEELPANCARFSDFQKIYDNKLYEVADLHLSDGEGNIAFTLTRTKLHHGQQTRSNTRDYNRIVQIQEGEGIFLLNNLAVKVKPGIVMVVPKGIKMKVINFKESTDLIYLQTLPAQLIRTDVKRSGLV
jgi:quercetin dioxygenase-like cupin family protein